MQEQLTPDFGDYELLDTGDFEKLERFGRYVTRRPEPQAIWRRSLAEEEWRRMADASFRRDARSDERGEWRLAPGMPDRWVVEYAYKRMRLRMRLGLTSFKHVGIFPEQAANWNFIYDNCRALAGDGPTDGERVAAVGSGVARGGAPKVLNLFAYTGGATLAARAAGAEVTHVDSVRQVVTWSRENMELSGLEGVRWIVEDALKFVRREVRRGSLYRGIILDPPAYGRRRRAVDSGGQHRRDAGVLRAAARTPGGVSGAEPLLDGPLVDAGTHGCEAGVRRAARGAVGRAVFHRPGRQAAAVGNLLPVYAVGFAGGAGDALCFWQPSSSRNPVSRSAAQA